MPVAYHNDTLTGKDARRSLRSEMGERIPISMSEAREGWLLDCALGGMARGTVRGYRNGTGVLCSTECNDVPPNVTDFTATLARELMGAQIRRGLALSSVKTFYGQLCSFANWCVRNGYLAESPMRQIPCPKIPERVHRYLSQEELRRLWDAAETDEHKLILLLLLEGLRANELCQLRWKDVGTDRITVAFAKGGRVRAVPLSDGVRGLLKRRMDQASVSNSSRTCERSRTGDSSKSRPPHAGHISIDLVNSGEQGTGHASKRSPENSIAVRSWPQSEQTAPETMKTSSPIGIAANSTTDRILPMCVSTLEARLRLLGKRAGVAGVRPHVMRHTAASMGLRAGLDGESLRLLFGWRPGSQMLSRYTRSVQEDAALDRARALAITDRLLRADSDAVSGTTART